MHYSITQWGNFEMDTGSDWLRAMPTGIAGLRVPSWYRFHPVELTESDRAMLAEFGITDEETLGAIENMRRDFAETFCPVGAN